MKTSFLLKSAVVLLAATLLFAGCASSTMINSTPSGAKVVINGEAVGVTPYLYTDTKIVGSLVTLDLTLEGYEPIYTSFRRSEEFNVGTFIGGCFVWPFWLWTMDYKAKHNYELVPLSINQSAELPVIQSNTSRIERLKELKQMLDEKLINQEEFEKQKKKILDEQ